MQRGVSSPLRIAESRGQGCADKRYLILGVFLSCSAKKGSKECGIGGQIAFLREEGGTRSVTEGDGASLKQAISLL